jgi:aspartate oxidase
MTRDDIIRLAREAGVLSGYESDLFQRFAALVTEAVKGEWAGLTDEEFNDCLVVGDPCENLAEPEAWAVMKEVEAKLKEKNA